MHNSTSSQNFIEKKKKEEKDVGATFVKKHIGWRASKKYDKNTNFHWSQWLFCGMI